MPVKVSIDGVNGVADPHDYEFEGDGTACAVFKGDGADLALCGHFDGLQLVGAVEELARKAAAMLGGSVEARAYVAASVVDALRKGVDEDVDKLMASAAASELEREWRDGRC